MRAIFEELGADVGWDAGTETASGTLDGVTVNITIDESVMYRNGEAVTLDQPAVIIDGRTLVPVRAISESFGCSVTWDGSTQSVYIISESGDHFIPELVPGYSGSAYTVINGNDPYFTETSDVSFENYSELDYLGPLRRGLRVSFLGYNADRRTRRHRLGNAYGMGNGKV